jgi:hypothetical protein
MEKFRKNSSKQMPREEKCDTIGATKNEGE